MRAMALAAGLALFAGAAAATDPSDNPLVARHVEELLAAPVPADMRELLVVAEQLRLAGSTRWPAALRLAERRALLAIAGKPAAAASTLEAALRADAEREHKAPRELADLRRGILQSSLTMMPNRPGDRFVRSFRNVSSTPLLGAHVFVMGDEGLFLACVRQVTAATSAISPGGVVELQCSQRGEKDAWQSLEEELRPLKPKRVPGEVAVTYLHFSPPGFVVRAGSAWGDDSVREQSSGRLARAAPPPPAPAADDVPPPAAPRRTPEQMEADMLRVYLIALGGPIALGLLVGLPIGARAARPAATARSALLAVAVIAFFAIAVVGLPMFGGLNTGNLEGQLGAIFLGVGFLAGLVLAFLAWGLFAIGVIAGGLFGTAFRKRRAPSAGDGTQGVPMKR